VFGFALAGSGGTGAYYFPLLRAAAQDTGRGATVTPHPHPSVSGRPAAPPAPAPTSGVQPFTVLLLGSDNDGKDGNNQTPLTQSVILVRVNPQAGSVVMLSLPRDLIIDCYDSSGADIGSQKLDACFEEGTFPNDAAAAMAQTLENTFGIQVDNWAWIGLQGLVNLINYVGGVDVVVSSPVMDDLYPADVGTSNAYGYQRLAILPGPQHMNGQQALDYVRTRHASTYGDFSRSARQQQVLVALRQKLQYLSPADLPAIENAMQGQFYTSMTVTQMAQLLPLAPAIKDGSVTQMTLASPQYTSEQTITTDGQPDDVVYGDFGAIDQLIWQYFPQVAAAG
jgi:LCP family protein required for cell wall assembly